MKKSIEKNNPPKKKQKLMYPHHQIHPDLPVNIQPPRNYSLSPATQNMESGIYMVPVHGYENFLAVSKFAEYLDNVSGALKNTEYQMKRAKIMVKHNSNQIQLDQHEVGEVVDDDDDDDDELVIDGVDTY